MLKTFKNILTVSLRRQLVIGIALVHAILMSIFVLDMVSRQYSFLYKQNISQTESLSKTLAANSVSWVLASDVRGLEEVISSLSHYQGIRYAMVLDRHGKVLGHTDSEKIGLYISDAVSTSLLTASVKKYVLVKNKEIIDVASPVIANGRLIGWSRVALSQHGLISNLNVIGRDGIIYTLIAIIIGTIFAVVMAKGLTLGLTHLVSVADQIKEGDLSRRSNLERNDEIGRLSTDFNQMLDSLEDSHQQLAASRELAQVTLNSIGDAVITTDQFGKITFMNPVAENLTGWRSSEVQDKYLEEVFSIVNENTGEYSQSPVRECLASGEIIELENHTVLINRYGQRIPIEDSAAPIRNLNNQIVGVVMVFHDVSIARKMARQMHYQATHDVLTGLVNRMEFEKRLNHLIDNMCNSDDQHAFLYMDLDQFKIVNDTCGHVAGDELLKQLGFLFKENIRHHDTIARLGGDEFGVLLESCDIENAVHVAEKMLQTTRDFRFVWQENVFDIGVSIGLIPVAGNAYKLSSLLSMADIACYTAKDRGRNRFHIYEHEDTEMALRHSEMQWVSRITRALEEDRFVLFSQEIVSTNLLASSTHHFEILVRMKDESGELVMPEQFIPAAERYNLMSAIDRWVCKCCFEMLANIPENIDYMVSVNLSGDSFNNDNFLQYLTQLLKDNALPGNRICFEITETAAITNLTSAVHFIRTMKGYGCCFALDDFGSGLSSFAYLKNLPVDYIKIDGSFVKDMISDPIDREMVSSIHQVGKLMGIESIAEFVETDEIYASLREIGVNFAQGYGIAKPEPFAGRLARLVGSSSVDEKAS